MRARSFVLYWILASGLLVFGREQAGTNTPLSLEALRKRLTAHVAQDRFRSAEWGIEIVSLQSGAPIFETNAQKLLKPASTAKLFTGALALDVLGPEYKIRTSIHSRSSPQNGVLSGDLIIYGRGDPTFSTTFGAPGTNVLEKLVTAIRQTGITEIQGDLIGDSTYFSGPPYGTGWTWDDLQYYYGAEVTALCVQDNAIDLVIRPGDAVGAPCRIDAKCPLPFIDLVNRTKTASAKSSSSVTIERPIGQNRAYISGSLPKGSVGVDDSVSVPNAPLFFAAWLKEELARAGIPVRGQARAITYPEGSIATAAGVKELASVTSPELAVIVQKMMKLSHNLYAQLLLLEVGATTAEPGARGNTTEEWGIKRLREFTARAGIRPGDVMMDDGAGLSRSGLVTAEAMVQLLQFMARHKAADAFRNSLPEAGTDGTLRSRLKELKGNLRAKTGTIRYVNALSGYLTTSAGEEVAFSVMLNASAAPGASNKDEIDVIPRLVAQLAERTAQRAAQ